MIRGHGGNIIEASEIAGCRPSEIVDMSSNINPLGPPPGLIEHLRQHMDAVCALPEVDAGKAVEAYAQWQKLAPESVLAGSGTTQFLYQMPRALDIASALIVAPTYADYADALAINGVDFHYFMLNEKSGFVPDIEALRDAAKSVDAVYICNPDNPTGVLIPTDDIAGIARACPETWFVVDESYLPFADGCGDDSIARRGLSNVIVLQSLSKMFCIPGLRVGFCVVPAGA
ncbi:MAG: pyridoxal phosphate-dependent aminotransferase, partial [Thermodesulfobacteriota bacterium]